MPWAVRDALPRLRCQACHDRPATVALIENPAGQANLQAAPARAPERLSCEKYGKEPMRYRVA